MLARARRSFIVLLAIWPAIALARPPAAAPAPTASWLLDHLATQARGEGRAAAQTGHEADARTWNAWADIYEGLARTPNAGHMSAVAFAQALAQANHQSTALASRYGAAEAAKLFAASERFWAVIAAQLQRGRALAVAFPPEMLHAIPGLPESPWASQAATPTVQRLVLCGGLATRVQQCQARLAEMRHEQAMGQANNGDAIVVEMTQCDRAQESYVASCSR